MGSPFKSISKPWANTFKVNGESTQSRRGIDLTSMGNPLNIIRKVIGNQIKMQGDPCKRNGKPSGNPRKIHGKSISNQLGIHPKSVGNPVKSIWGSIRNQFHKYWESMLFTRSMVTCHPLLACQSLIARHPLKTSHWVDRPTVAETVQVEPEENMTFHMCKRPGERREYTFPTAIKTWSLLY